MDEVGIKNDLALLGGQVGVFHLLRRCLLRVLDKLLLGVDGAIDLLNGLLEHRQHILGRGDQAGQFAEFLVDVLLPAAGAHELGIDQIVDGIGERLVQAAGLARFQGLVEAVAGFAVEVAGQFLDLRQQRIDLALDGGLLGAEHIEGILLVVIEVGACLALDDVLQVERAADIAALALGDGLESQRQLVHGLMLLELEQQRGA